MAIDPHYFLAVLMALAAALYSSVGHGGASSYIALMALFGIEPGAMRPTALTLNILVASLGALRYVRAGMFRWRILWPFLIGSIPMAFIGGAIHLPGNIYRPLVGSTLILASLRLFWPKEIAASRNPHDPPIVGGAICGALLGFLSGLTGTGGGIFLSPVLLFAGWSGARTSLGIVSLFILCNSLAGLLGNVAAVKALPPDLPIYAAGVLFGGALGTTFGIRFRVPAILKALGLVLLIAGAKLFDLY